MGENMSLSDIAAVTGNNNGFGNSWILIILFALIFGGGGFYGNGNGRAATVEDLNNSANATRVENQIDNLSGLTERKADGIVNGISSLGYEVAQQFGNTNTTMAQGFCNTSKEILESRYLNEKAIADSNANIVAQINALSAKMDADKIATLQAQVNELKTQQLFCGVPKINPYAYGVYNTAPQLGCGCGNV